MDVKEQVVTTVELPQAETQFLLEILASTERELLAEITRTETREYRGKLSARLGLLESVRARILNSRRR